MICCVLLFYVHLFYSGPLQSGLRFESEKLTHLFRSEVPNQVIGDTCFISPIITKGITAITFINVLTNRPVHFDQCAVYTSRDVIAEYGYWKGNQLNGTPADDFHR
jgi:hypothetical protein